jgi:surfactin family lipopeptide synthetase A
MAPRGNVVTYFERQVQHLPEKPALTFEDQTLSYQELNRRANQLAHALSAWGVGPDVLVGVCMERSIEMVVALVAILKAGGAYVPLDPGYPEARLAYMLQDAQPPVLLTQSTIAARLPQTGAKVVRLDSYPCEGRAEYDENPTSGVQPDNLIYMIYTSGSTGKPKGVMMHHQAFTNLIDWQLREVPCGGRVLQYAPTSFDVSVQECFTALSAGSTLVLLAEDERHDFAALWKRISNEHITHLFIPPVVLQQLCESALNHLDTYPSSLKRVIVAGEQLLISPIIRSFFVRTGCSLENQYGPAETHVVSSYPLMENPASWPDYPPIGKPISGVHLWILDQSLRPVKPGEQGEIYIGGVCVAHGYHHRPDLTALRFVLDPFSQEPGTRLYRTGDLGRELPDGNIKFLGRSDQQVKIRGFRVELGEIESTLLQHPDIAQVTVVAREDTPGSIRLVAYIVMNALPVGCAAPSLETLRSFLQKKLPDYMIPAAFVTLSALPLSPNGKVDRKALPAPPQARPALAQPFVAPRTPLEGRIARIWREVLSIDGVGVHDTFADLGGDSLHAMQIAARMRVVWGREDIDLPLGESTVESQALHLRRLLERRGEGQEGSKV